MFQHQWKKAKRNNDVLMASGTPQPPSGRYTYYVNLKVLPRSQIIMFTRLDL